MTTGTGTYNGTAGDDDLSLFGDGTLLGGEGNDVLSTTSLYRASTATDGTEGTQESFYGSLSPDGRYVAFYSLASNLVADDTNSSGDIFVRDLQTGVVTRVSTAADDTQTDSGSYAGRLSADGRHLVFEGTATNLVAGDTNGSTDIFVRDMQTGSVTRISTAADGTEGNGGSWLPSVSADGRYVVFYSEASNLVANDTNGVADVFLHDLQTGTAALNGTGNALDNALTGNDAVNVLTGNSGANRLDGGAGADTLAGGAGKDVFRFTAANQGGDTITDFAAGDRLAFTARGFGGLRRGALSATAFESLASSSAATTAQTRFIYNQSQRALYYDADGTGARAAVRIATFGNTTGPSANSILIV